MAKSKDHIKRFLSSLKPAKERDEHLIRLFLSKRKIKLSAPEEKLDMETLASITYEQFESWYNADLPTAGDIIKCEENGHFCLVLRENWDSYVIGATLTPKNELTFEEHIITSKAKISSVSDAEVQAFQKALSVEGYDWSPSLSLVKRDIPQSPKYVRLMVMGKPVGIGIFKKIRADNTLEMFCVKMKNEPIRYGDHLTLGDADYFSFFDTYDEHRAVIQQELGEMNLIWNARCRRIQKNNARAKAGENYFWVSSFLEIKLATETGSISDKRRFNRGNYFLKRKVALRARDRFINMCKEEMLSEDNI